MKTEISFYKGRLNNNFIIALATGNDKKGYKIEETISITKKQALELAEQINKTFKHDKTLS